ncbi:MAG: peptidylprolyl isomerase [Mycobacteriaceae bacterium]|nr:peptidylprolyl isomerase [Mycobacteriaceae bacterium]
MTACNSTDSAAASPSDRKADSAPTAQLGELPSHDLPPAGGCGYTAAAPAVKNVGTPSFNPAAAAKPFTASLHTNTGVVTFNAFADKAPCTTNSLHYLAEHKYFDGTRCHRLTTKGIYVLQCGDPTGTGTGGPGYSFPDENLAGATYPAGTVAMANAGPNTNGSQFFLVYRDTQLPPNYTPFGRITGGLDVLNRIAAEGNDEANGPGDGHPRKPVVINNVSLG